MSRPNPLLEPIDREIMMPSQLFFPDNVIREIQSAADAADVTARVSHVELAVLHFEASGEAPGDTARCRQMIETAVFTQIAFALDRDEV